MVSTIVTINIPADLVKELDTLADETGVSREDALRSAIARQIASERQWRDLKAEMARLGKESGITTEDELEDFMDSLEDDPD